MERTDEIGLETIFLVHSISSKLLYLTTESEGGLGPLHLRVQSFSLSHAELSRAEHAAEHTPS